MHAPLTTSAVVILPFAAAAGTALVLWALLASGAAHRLALDAPNARSLHVAPTPRIGGLVLVPVALMLAMLAAPLPPQLVGATALLVVVGAVDDRRGLHFVLRLAVQVIAATLLLWPAVGALGVPMALTIAVALVWGMNAYNFMDGSDGLAGGMALIGFATCAVAAAASGDGRLIALSLALAGAAGGFLLLNFAPARVFLGDGGSVPLGFLAGAIALLGTGAGHWSWWFVPLVFSPFLVDATVTLVARGIAGKRVWQAHREHAYQRLVQAGCTHRNVALGAYGLMLASVGIAVLAESFNGAGYGAFIAAAWATALSVAVLFVRRRWPAQ
jgi:UDP-N-acetylmuramyl pentapeptide phosphotransferase/UDP-N-acetylglucosamine-1-phosphate transferase